MHFFQEVDLSAEPRNKTGRQLRKEIKGREPCSPGLRKYVCLILPEIRPAVNAGEGRTKGLTGSQQWWREKEA